jgi:hypothetical protein
VVATPKVPVLKSENRRITGRMCGRIDRQRSISIEFMALSELRLRSIDHDEIDQTQFLAEHSLGSTSLFLPFSL